MQVANTVEEVRSFVKAAKEKGQSIGLVPTMGNLHAGHVSLIHRARQENDIVIVSDFVNPTQFAPNEDLDAYPRTFDDDMEKCEAEGVDLVFHPTPEVMYRDHKTYVKVEELSDKLEGVTRPTHFRGVATVCLKLFNISQADRAYYGQKDAQQLIVLRKMVEDLNVNIELIACPIVRDEEGLALSSRNQYMNAEEKKAALALSQAIQLAKGMIQKGTKSEEIIAVMADRIQQEKDVRIDYIQVVDPVTLDPVESVEGKVLVAEAVFMGTTVRLIDNFVFEPGKGEVEL